MVQTVIVGIDLRYNNRNLAKFRLMPFEKQLEAIGVKIRSICSGLQRQYPNANWIITWREYGLTDRLQRNITTDQKNNLKRKLSWLTDEYPNLTIISGTVLTSKFVSPEDETLWQKQEQDLTSSYKNHLEKSPNDPQILKHHQDAEAILKKRLPYLRCRNTAYVFKGGQCVFRHDKVSPFEETERILGGIFRPGMGKASSPYFDDTISVEICREHGGGYLSYILSNEQKQPSEMQFILSASIDVFPKHIVSPFVIHMDSNEGVVVVTDEANKGRDKLHVFFTNILEKKLKLEYAPVHTIYATIYSLIEAAVDTGVKISLTTFLANHSPKNYQLTSGAYETYTKWFIDKFIDLDVNPPKLTAKQRANCQGTVLELIQECLPHISSDLVITEHSRFKSLFLKLMEYKQWDVMIILCEDYAELFKSLMSDYEIISSAILNDQLKLLNHFMDQAELTFVSKIGIQGQSIEQIIKLFRPIEINKQLDIYNYLNHIINTQTHMTISSFAINGKFAVVEYGLLAKWLAEKFIEIAYDGTADQNTTAKRLDAVWYMFEDVLSYVDEERLLKSHKLFVTLFKLVIDFNQWSLLSKLLNTHLDKLSNIFADPFFVSQMLKHDQVELFYLFVNHVDLPFERVLENEQTVLDVVLMQKPEKIYAMYLQNLNAYIEDVARKHEVDDFEVINPIDDLNEQDFDEAEGYFSDDITLMSEDEVQPIHSPTSVGTHSIWSRQLRRWPSDGKSCIEDDNLSTFSMSEDELLSSDLSQKLRIGGQD